MANKAATMIIGVFITSRAWLKLKLSCLISMGLRNTTAITATSPVRKEHNNGTLYPHLVAVRIPRKKARSFPTLLKALALVIAVTLSSSL